MRKRLRITTKIHYLFVRRKLFISLFFHKQFEFDEIVVAAAVSVTKLLTIYRRNKIMLQFTR